jgi:hypothetical protein
LKIKGTEKGALSSREALLFLLCCKIWHFFIQESSIHPQGKKNTRYQTGMEATILFIFTTTAVK